MKTTRFSYERKNSQYIVYRVTEWQEAEGYHINFEAVKKTRTLKAAYEEVQKLNTEIRRRDFNDSDDFASYIFDSVLFHGEKVTEEFNEITGLSLPLGTNLYNVDELPNTGKNYKQFGTVKSWLYDLYERKYFKFKEGQKVNWVNGQYEFYTVRYSFKDCGQKLYSLTNPSGSESGGRVREDELTILNN